MKNKNKTVKFKKKIFHTLSTINKLLTYNNRQKNNIRVDLVNILKLIYSLL